jgi:outer membrane protein
MIPVPMVLKQVEIKVQGYLGAALGLALLLGGCRGPMQRTPEQVLRDSMIAAHRSHLAAVSGSQVMTLSREPSDVESELSVERRAELDQMSGMSAYRDRQPDQGIDLMGSDSARVVRLSLQEAVALAVRHNLDLRVARMTPAIRETRIVQAQAVFDATFFTNINYSKQDTPQPGGLVPGLSGNIKREDVQLSTGIRKPLISGGQITAQADLNRNESVPSIFGVPKFYNADVLVRLEQPLLRNFGSDVNRSNIVLAQNDRLAEAQQLRSRLLDIVARVEAGYWDVAFSHQQVLVRMRLLERSTQDRDRLIERRGYDASPVEITEANSFVELHRADVIRARSAMRVASDRLKRLINAPDLPLADETLVMPVDSPTDVPISFSLLDLVTTALRHRPEMQIALLDIKDASVRQRVADNARLPLLNLAATVQMNGVAIANGQEAYDNLGDADFIDYILGAQFEMPIGNRSAEGLYRQRQLERRAAALVYQRQAQDVVLEVKVALRNVQTSYELIGATRAARRAAADSLRAIEVQEASGVALTPQFLINQKLSTQERLANAEVQEAQALTDYHNAIAVLYQSVGTLLERNNIEFRTEPDAG